VARRIVVARRFPIEVIIALFAADGVGSAGPEKEVGGGTSDDVVVTGAFRRFDGIISVLFDALPGPGLKGRGRWHFETESETKSGIGEDCGARSKAGKPGGHEDRGRRIIRRWPVVGTAKGVSRPRSVVRLVGGGFGDPLRRPQDRARFGDADGCQGRNRRWIVFDALGRQDRRRERLFRIGTPRQGVVEGAEGGQFAVHGCGSRQPFEQGIQFCLDGGLRKQVVGFPGDRVVDTEESMDDFFVGLDLGDPVGGHLIERVGRITRYRFGLLAGLVDGRLEGRIGGQFGKAGLGGDGNGVSGNGVGGNGGGGRGFEAIRAGSALRRDRGAPGMTAFAFDFGDPTGLERTVWHQFLHRADRLCRDSNGFATGTAFNDQGTPKRFAIKTKY